MLKNTIKELRKENNMTQSELAQKIGITTSSVGMYETGVRQPSYEVLYKLSEVFNVTTDYLLGKSDTISANGHPEKNIIQSGPQVQNNETLNLQKRFYKIIFSEFFNEKMRPSINTSSDKFREVVVQMKDSEFSEWLLQFNSDISADSLLSLYGSIALLQFKPDQKVTIVVHTEESYALITTNPPRSFRINLFVMLVDLDAGNIIKEEKLCQF